MDIRPYTPADREDCLALFDSNTPRFFALAERPAFVAFLDNPNCPYLVLEHENRIVGSGGYAIHRNQSLASLVWGMVHANSQQLGLGRFLLLYRIREIGKVPGIESVRLETSQHTAPFFQKQGFRSIGHIPDGFAQGIDRIEMIKKLTVCA